MSSYQEIAQNFLKKPDPQIGGLGQDPSTQALAQRLYAELNTPQQPAQAAPQVVAPETNSLMPAAEPSAQLDYPVVPNATAQPVQIINSHPAEQTTVSAAPPGAIDPVDQHLAQDRASVRALDAQSTRDTNAQLADINAGALQESQGREEKAAAEAVINTDKEAQLNAEAEHLAQFQTAQKQLDDWHTETQMKIQNQLDGVLEQEQKLAASNPQDLWGNWGIGQKVAGVIGLIGAGFAHQDAAQRVDRLVDQAIHARDSKLRAYQLVGNQIDDIGKQNEEVFGSKQNALTAQKAAMLEVFAKQMEITSAHMANPIAQANLKLAAGQALQASAKLKDEVIQGGTKAAYNGLREQVQLTGIEAQRQQAALRANGPNAASIKLQKEKDEGAVEGFDGYINKGDRRKFVLKQGQAHSLIDNVDRAKGLLDQITEQEKHGKIDPELVSQYNALKDGALPAWRIYSESGARLEAGEEKKFENLFPSISYTLLGGYKVLGGRSGLDESRDIIVNSIKRSGEAIAKKTATFDPDYPLYAPSTRRAAEREKHKAAVERANKAASDARAAQ